MTYADVPREGEHELGFYRDGAAIKAEPREPRWRGSYGYATCACSWRSPLTRDHAERYDLWRKHVTEATR